MARGLDEAAIASLRAAGDGDRTGKHRVLVRPDHDIAAGAGAAPCPAIGEDLRARFDGRRLRIGDRVLRKILRRDRASLPVPADEHRAAIARSARVDHGIFAERHILRRDDHGAAAKAPLWVPA